MCETKLTLATVFSGWDGYQRSLVAAIAPLTEGNLRYRLPGGERSVGEIAAHVAIGRIDWFNRMGAPGAAALVEAIAPWWRPWHPIDPSAGQSAERVVGWLEASWGMMEGCLSAWTVDDLATTYLQPYGGKTYAVSRQWTIWRVMAHDIHHGGQLSVLLTAQGIHLPELGDNGGHIVEVPEAPSQ